MTVVVGLVFLAALAALHWIHARRHRRDKRDQRCARADFDAEYRSLLAKTGTLITENRTLRRLLAEQCQQTLEWKAVAAAQFTRVIDLRTEQTPATQPATLTLMPGGRDERGRFAKVAQ